MEAKRIPISGLASLTQVRARAIPQLTEFIELTRLKMPAPPESRAASIGICGANHNSERVSQSGLPDRLRALLAVEVDHLLPGPDSRLDWPGPLYPFQREGVSVLINRRELLLADDMGLGKTVQALTALRVLMRRGDISRAIVVVPASLIHQWRDAFAHWARDLRVSTVRGSPEARVSQWNAEAHVYLTTYETVRADFGSGSQGGPSRHIWDLAILDEAQRIKNRLTSVSVICKQIPRRRSWALTGTPLENTADDLASVMEFLFSNPEGVRPTPLSVDANLLERHREIQVRRRKADVLRQLPPKTVERVLLDLTPGQRAAYDRAETEGVVELRSLGQTVRITHVLALIMKLKQICNFCPQTGQSAKMNDLAERMETLAAEGHRALVFSQFTDDTFGAQAIAARLAAHRPLLFTGTLSLDERDRVVTKFKADDDRRVMVLSLRAGGQGLNLQEASYVVHFDRWWNPAVEHQAEDRAHRIGQEQPVMIYTYSCLDTVEERIDELLAHKQRLFNAVIDDVDRDIQELLSASELFGIFGLSPPPRGRVV